MIIENKDSSVFEVLDSGYVMNIKKSGYYRVNIKANNNSAQDSTFIIYWSTTSPTSGYSIFEVAPYTNVVNTVLSHSTIWEITQPCYIMFALLSNQWPYYNIISFEKMISDEVIINNTTTNYTNPVLQQWSKFIMNKIASNTFANVNLFNNQTSPVYYLRVTNGLMNYENLSSDISFVEATPTVTTYSYFQFNSVKWYWVSLTA